MKSTHLILAIGWVALLPPSFASGAKPTRHALPAPSAAREVNYEVIADDDVHLAGEVSQAGCSGCNTCGVETVSCGDGVTCGLLSCGSCDPCGSPLGECNATCFTPQIKRRLYKVPCATACCDPPRVGSVFIEVMDAMRAKMYELKQTGFNRCDDGCGDDACCDASCGTTSCGGGLLSSGLLSNCFGATASDWTVCDDGCSQGSGGALGCTSCGDACGGMCGGSCGVGFLGGGKLASFLAACRSRLAYACAPIGCSTYWGQFEGECIDGGCIDSGCTGTGCGDGACSGGCGATTFNTTSHVPNSAQVFSANPTNHLPRDVGTSPKPHGGLLGFLFPPSNQSTQDQGRVHIVSTRDQRVGESVVRSHQRQSGIKRASIASTTRGEVIQRPPVARVDHHTTARRSDVRQSSGPPTFSR